MADILIQGLTKRYGENKGVFDLGLQVEKGEAYGFIGPNGAGKTTTIRHLMGFLNPDSGVCQIRGMDCRRQVKGIHRLLGYIPGEIAFIDNMKGDAYLHFLENLRLKGSAKRKNELLERFELDAGVDIKKMSKGMKQKLGLVAALMHDPEILVLDEPTSGLDPLMQQSFVQLIHEEKQRGKTMLISSHSFDEIEKTCDRVGILNQGRMLTQQTMQTLEEQKRRIYSLRFLEQSALEEFKKQGYETVFESGLRLDVAFTGSLQPFLRTLSRYPLAGLNVLNQKLEDIFLSYYGGAGHE